MKLFRSDHLFEEAARSTESCDKLLKRLQRERKFNLISILVLALVALTLCLLAFIPLMGWLHSPTFPMPPSLDWLVTSFPPSLIYSILMVLFVGLTGQFALMLHNDVCIKMLLFMRGHRPPPNTASDSHTQENQRF